MTRDDYNRERCTDCSGWFEVYPEDAKEPHICIPMVARLQGRINDLIDEKEYIDDRLTKAVNNHDALTAENAALKQKVERYEDALKNITKYDVPAIVMLRYAQEALKEPRP